MSASATQGGHNKTFNIVHLGVQSLNLSWSKVLN